MSPKTEQTIDWPNLAREAGYSAATLARLRCVSVRHLERDFRRTMGQTPKKWLNALRIYDGREMLEGGKSVKEVASYLKYKHSQSFSRAFKSILGVSPSGACGTPSAEGRPIPIG
jgi:AraC-like DNA-binding protein